MRVGSAAASHPASRGWPVLTSAGPAQKRRQLRARRVSGASHWREWRGKEFGPSQTSCYSFMITKDVPAALKGFSQRTVSGLKNQQSLAPTYCCNISRTKLQSITWLQSLSPGHCHCMPPPKKAELASYQCTNAEVWEVRAFCTHFPWSRAEEVWGLQRLQWISWWTVTALLSGSLAPKSTKSRLAQLVGHTSAGHIPWLIQSASQEEQQGHNAVRRRPGFLKSFLSFSSNRIPP